MEYLGVILSLPTYLLTKVVQFTADDSVQALEVLMNHYPKGSYQIHIYPVDAILIGRIDTNPTLVLANQ